jgi:hypothetical protein
VSQETIHLYTNVSTLRIRGFYFKGTADQWFISPSAFVRTLTKCHAFLAKIMLVPGETFDINPFEIAAIWLAFTT